MHVGRKLAQFLLFHTPHSLSSLADKMSSDNGWLGTLPPYIKAKAFLRTDAYGTYANNKLSLALKLRLVLVCLTLVPVKLFASLFCVVSYYLFISVGNVVLKEPYKTKYMAFWGRFWTRMLLYALGFWTIKWVYVSPDGSTSSTAPAGFLERRFGGYVSNHCRWEIAKVGPQGVQALGLGSRRKGSRGKGSPREGRCSQSLMTALTRPGGLDKPNARPVPPCHQADHGIEHICCSIGLHCCHRAANHCTQLPPRAANARPTSPDPQPQLPLPFTTPFYLPPPPRLFSSMQLGGHRAIHVPSVSVLCGEKGGLQPAAHWGHQQGHAVPVRGPGGAVGGSGGGGRQGRGGRSGGERRSGHGTGGVARDALGAGW